jgi:hypothetical protein
VALINGQCASNPSMSRTRSGWFYKTAPKRARKLQTKGIRQ